MSTGPGAGARPPGWTGAWVAERLGVTVAGDDVAGLVGLAVRRNPRRAHLLVSRVLGKHVPTDPRLVRAAGLLLGVLVAQALDVGRAGPAVADLEPVRRACAGDLDAASARAAVLAAVGSTTAPPAGTVVLGYAETATGLGALVAEALRVEHLHTTRRVVAAVPAVGGFDEEHSHATGHLLSPADPALLARDAPLVLVDDELSTGRTVANTVRALHALHPRARYVVAALVDLRDPAQQGELDALAAELGTRVDVVSLAAGTVHAGPDVLAAGARLVDALEREPRPGSGGRAQRVDPGWPAGLPASARHGSAAGSHDELDAALPALGRRLGDALPEGTASVLVLGSEELMHAPLRLAEALADARPGLAVRFSSTTRSPVLAVADPGYAVTDRLVFPAHDDPADGPGPRFAYNTTGAGDVVVLVVDDAADTAALHGPGGLVDQLGSDRAVLLVVLPARPAT